MCLIVFYSQLQDIHLQLSNIYKLDFLNSFKCQETEQNKCVLVNNKRYKNIGMNSKKDESNFLLRLTFQERKKLKKIAMERNITMTSLVRHVLQNDLKISDI